MKTAVIIPNYNGKRFLDPCMSALSGQTYRDFCVIIVDNGSTDGSVELIRSYEEKGLCEAVLLSENTGFSGAVNAGIEHALKDPEEPEYLVLLNNDTEADSGYLASMTALLEADRKKTIGAVSPRMLSMADHSHIDSAGDGYAVCGWAFQRGVGRNADCPKFGRVTGVFSACAGAAMYRTEALRKIRFSDGDFFDLRHFAYLEDVDVSFRMRSRGYRIVYDPASVVYHYGSGTSGSRYNGFKVRLAARNNVYLNWKNQPVLMLLFNLPAIAAGLLVKWLFFVKMGYGKIYAKGFLEGLQGLPSLKGHVIYFRPENTGNYLKIEFRMIADMFSYLGDLFSRKILHK